MNLSGKKIVFIILIVIAVMAVVTWGIFNYMEKNEYIEEMSLEYLGLIFNQRGV